MEETKIQLSEDELLLMQNSDWILTKNSIIEKIVVGLGALLIKMQLHTEAHLPSFDEIVITSSSKISRGEKYLGLPYVILDYPRIFGKKDILAIRTLFWWGNYCSVTLHVKGGWQQIVLQKILSRLDHLSNSSFYISFSGDEWSHNLQDTDYILLQSLSREILQKLPEEGFLKLAAKVPIGSWSNMEKELFDLFLDLIELVKT